MGTTFTGTSVITRPSPSAVPGRLAARATPFDARLGQTLPPAPSGAAAKCDHALTESEVVAVAVADVANTVRGALHAVRTPVFGAAAVGLVASVVQQSRARQRHRFKLRHARQSDVCKVRRLAQPDKGGEDDFNFDMIDALIQQSRSACDLGVDTLDWHEEMFDEVPEGYRKALMEGVEVVDVMAGSDALRLIGRASSSADSDELPPPRYNLRLTPRSTMGLGMLLHKGLVKSWSVLAVLQKSLRALRVGSVETLTLHGESGRLSFPSWVYDAIAEAYQEGLISRVGVSHPNATAKSLARVRDELQNRNVLLSCVYVRLSLLDRRALPLVEECKDMGLQVFATGPLGEDELASGRYTSSNPTGGEIGVPKFTLAQLMPLRPLHTALDQVAARVRSRTERKDIDTTQVAMQWCISKGASPVVDPSSDANARALVGCKDWTLEPEEVTILEKAVDELPGKGR